MENNSIIDKLMENNLSDSQKNKAGLEDSSVLITSYRVTSVRYKIYIVFLILIGFFFANNYLLPIYQKYNKVQDKMAKIQTELIFFEAKKLKTLSDKALINEIDKNNEQIISFFNGVTLQDNLPPNILSNSGLVKSFMDLSDLSHNKMVVNETVILANINEYLLKDKNKNKNGNLKKIEIGQSEVFGSERFFHLPIILEITFDNKDGLFAFIDNIEKYILPDPQYRILYKINSISYDVVQYQEEQEVSIELSAYYFK